MSTTYAGSDTRLTGITAVPSGGPLAAEVRGVDLRNVSDADFAAIHRLWIENLVLLFRDQTLMTIS